MYTNRKFSKAERQERQRMAIQCLQILGVFRELFTCFPGVPGLVKKLFVSKVTMGCYLIN